MRKTKLKQPRITTEKTKKRWLYCRGLSAVWSPFLYERRKKMDNRILKQLFPGVDEKYIERAFEKLKKNGCPEGGGLADLVR